LSNGGEQVALQFAEPLDTAILRFDYSASWYPTTDGQGASLSIVDPQLDFRHWSRAESWQATAPSPGRAPGENIPGDLNGDGLVDASDIDRLCVAIHSQEAGFDLNGDQQLDLTDLDYLVKNILQTTYGDSNLDGIFNSADLVLTFAAGQYEDNVPGNSSWQDGDWNCDGEFSTQDLVVAFQEGGYVAAAQPVVNASLASLAAATAPPGRQVEVTPRDTTATTDTPPARRGQPLEPQVVAAIWATAASESRSDSHVGAGENWLDELAEGFFRRARSI
jgi:hypothetical protein